MVIIKGAVSCGNPQEVYYKQYVIVLRTPV
jgi:hypothetical protein